MSRQKRSPLLAHGIAYLLARCEIIVIDRRPHIEARAARKHAALSAYFDIGETASRIFLKQATRNTASPGSRIWNPQCGTSRSDSGDLRMLRCPCLCKFAWNGPRLLPRSRGMRFPGRHRFYPTQWAQQSRLRGSEFPNGVRPRYSASTTSPDRYQVELVDANLHNGALELVDSFAGGNGSMHGHIMGASACKHVFIAL